MKKRFLSVLLTLCMVLAMLPVTAMAAGADKVDSATGIATSGNTVYAIRDDVTFSNLVTAVPAKGTVRVDNTYRVATDTAAVEINKEFTLELNTDCAANLSVVENGVLTVTGSGKLTGTLTMSAGTYKGTLPTGAKTITGGTFDSDVSAYIAADYKCVNNGDGTYSVVKPVVVKPTETTNPDNTVNTTAEVKAEDVAKAEVTDGTLAITATTTTTSEVAKVEVTLPTTAIAEKTEVKSVQIETDVGTVDLPTEALTGVTENVTMSVEKTADPEPVAVPAEEGTAAKTVTVAASFQVDLKKASGDKVSVNNLASKIRLSFNVKGMTLPTNPVLAFINRAATSAAKMFEKLENGSYDATTGEIFGYVNHLSEFGVVALADIPAEPTTPDPTPGGEDPTTPTDPTNPNKREFTVTLDAQVEGGAGYVRNVIITPIKEGATVNGKYLVICIDKGVAAKNNTIIIVPADTKVPVSYDKASANAVITAVVINPDGTGNVPNVADSKILTEVSLGCNLFKD